MAPRVVLVTGVSRHLGGLLAARLVADPTIERVIGVDTVPPPRELAGTLGRTEFVRADIRNPLIAKVIAAAEVDTVVHLNITATPRGAGGRASMKEMNVIGTMQLLAACQKSASVRRLVVKSTTAVYGSSSRDPALFTEETEPKALPRSGYAKDAVEVEGYVRGFARRRPDVTVGVLRFTNFIGPADRQPAGALPRGCRWCRRSSASTPACSCCTRTTRWRCSGWPPRPGTPARSTSAAAACCCCPS